MPPVSEPARRVLARAQEEARALRHSYIGTEHMLLALLDEPEGVPRRLLEAHGVTRHAVRAKVVRMMGTGVENDAGALPFTVRAQAAVDLAEREAATLGDELAGSEHLLLALLREPRDASARILLELDVDPAALRDEVLRAVAAPGRSGQRRSPEAGP